MDFTEAYVDSCSQVGFAARTGDVQKLRELLASGKNYCIHDNRGWYPIHEASHAGNFQCVKELLAQAKLDDEDPVEIWPLPFDISQGSPLEMAVCSGSLDIVKILLPVYEKVIPEPAKIISQAVAYPQILLRFIDTFPNNLNTISGVYHETPIHSAINCANLESVKLLVTRGADVKYADEFGRTPLHVAASILTGQDTSAVDIVNFLIISGCEINAKDCDDCTPLYIAAQSNNADVVNSLLNFNADPHIPCRFTTECGDILLAAPISAAAEKGYLKITKTLSTYTDQSQLGCKNISSPVLTCIVAQQPECLDFLLNNGYDVSGCLPFCNVHLMTKEFIYGMDGVLDNVLPWDFSSMEGCLAKVVSILLKHKASLTIKLTRGSHFKQLLTSTRKSSVDVLKVLLVHGLIEFCFPKLPTIDQLSSHLEKLLVINPNPMLQSKLLILFSFIPNFVIDFVGIPIYPVILVTVPSLKQLCSWNIRCIALKNSNHMFEIKKLELPNSLIDSILFGNILICRLVNCF